MDNQFDERVMHISVVNRSDEISDDTDINLQRMMG